MAPRERYARTMLITYLDLEAAAAAEAQAAHDEEECAAENDGETTFMFVYHRPFIALIQ